MQEKEKNQKVFPPPHVSDILLSSHSLFLSPVRIAVLLFCRKYSSLYLSNTSFGSFLFLACLHALLSLDLNFMFTFSSVSTHVAAFNSIFFLPPGLLLSFLFIAKFTEALIFVIHFLKLIFLPILFLKSTTHLSILSGSLLIHVISFMFFFFFLVGFMVPTLNHALTRL